MLYLAQNGIAAGGGFILTHFVSKKLRILDLSTYISNRNE